MRQAASGADSAAVLPDGRAQGAAAARPALLRTREPHAHARVTFVELFFDLVFVFAVTQLSHALLHDPTPAGALRTGLLFFAVWWVWIYTSWVTNWLDPNRAPIRTLLFLLMLAGLVLSMAIPGAFGERGLAFALAYTAMQDTYLHLPVVAGIVVAAVGDEMVLHHPEGHADAAAVASILGGPALYLGGLLLFKGICFGWPPLSHLAGLGLLALLLALGAPALSPLALAASANAVLVLVAAWEHLSLRTARA